MNLLNKYKLNPNLLKDLSEFLDLIETEMPFEPQIWVNEQTEKFSKVYNPLSMDDARFGFEWKRDTHIAQIFFFGKSKMDSIALYFFDSQTGYGGSAGWNSTRWLLKDCIVQLFNDSKKVIH